MTTVVGIDGTVNPRLPLAVAIVVVLAAGAALVVIRPGDLAVDDGTEAVGAPDTSTTTTTDSPAGSPGADPGPDTGGPATPTTTASTIEPAPPTTRSPTTTTASVPSGRSGTTLPGAAGGGEPRLADTGMPGSLPALGLALVVAGVATWRSASRKRPLP